MANRTLSERVLTLETEIKNLEEDVKTITGRTWWLQWSPVAVILSVMLAAWSIISSNNERILELEKNVLKVQYESEYNHK